MNRLAEARCGLRAWICAAAVLAISMAAGAEPNAAPSRILSRSLYDLPRYEQLPKAPFGAVTAAMYEKIIDVGKGKLAKVTYASQGLRVVALVLPPARMSDGRYPVIVYCRGGVGPAGAIGLSNPMPLYEMSRYAEAGFIVVAPQYRGADGGEGRDEVGGDEINDVLAIADVLKSFAQADLDRIYLLGASRGAMLALQAIRAGFPAQGVAAVGAPTDWELAFAYTPGLRKVAEDFWPDHAGVEAITRRSAARWVQDISVPLLLQHGGADAVINPAVILDFARKLSEHGKSYDLVVYAGDDHLISQHLEERLDRTIAWLRQLPKGPVSSSPREVSVIAEDYRLTIPQRIVAGRNHFAFENRGREPHYFRLMKFADGKGIDDFLEWRRSRTGSPGWLTSAGGAGTLAPGERAGYTTDLSTGRYVVFCGHPSPDGIQHVDKGMYATLTVDPGPDLTPAIASQVSVELGDHRVSVEPSFRAGAQVAHVRNNSTHVHQALLIWLPAGIKPEDELAWFRGGSRGPRPGRPVGGVIELGPGREAWADFDLRPGRYLLICAIAAPDGQRHFDLGMIHSFEISTQPGS